MEITLLTPPELQRSTSDATEILGSLCLEIVNFKADTDCDLPDGSCLGPTRCNANQKCDWETIK